MTAAPNRPTVRGPHFASWSPHPDTRELPPLRLSTRGCWAVFLAIVVALTAALVAGQAKTNPIREQCEQIAAPAYVRDCIRDLNQGVTP